MQRQFRKARGTASGYQHMLTLLIALHVLTLLIALHVGNFYALHTLSWNLHCL